MQNLLLHRNNFFTKRARSIIGLFGVTENLTISKIVSRQNSVTQSTVLSANFDHRFLTVLKEIYHRSRTQSTSPENLKVEISLQDKWTLMSQNLTLVVFQH